LKQAGHAGRKARLRPEDLRRIERGFEARAASPGYETSLWTSWRVAHLIEQGMRGCSTTPRKPGGFCGSWAGVASVRWDGRWSRDEDKIRRWKQQRWPEIKKKPKKERRTICFHRRKRTERTPPALPYLGATRTDAGAAIFTLTGKMLVGNGGGDGGGISTSALFPGAIRSRRSSSFSHTCCAIFPASC